MTDPHSRIPWRSHFNFSLYSNAPLEQSSKWWADLFSHNELSWSFFMLGVHALVESSPHSSGSPYTEIKSTPNFNTKQRLLDPINCWLTCLLLKTFVLLIFISNFGFLSLLSVDTENKSRKKRIIWASYLIHLSVPSARPSISKWEFFSQ